jgi:hypothetical protein
MSNFRLTSAAKRALIIACALSAAGGAWAQSNLVKNPSFESVTTTTVAGITVPNVPTDWIQTSNSVVANRNICGFLSLTVGTLQTIGRDFAVGDPGVSLPTDGSRVLVGDELGSGCDASIYQDVALPAAPQTITLAVAAGAVFNSGGSGTSMASLDVQTPAGAQLVNLYNRTSAAGNDAMVDRTVDLSAYAGQTIRIVGRVANSGNNWGGLLLDNVRLSASGIPYLTNVPPVAGIVNQPRVSDMSSGLGSSVTNCLMGTVQALFGADAAYQGQSSSGAIRISQGGNIFSFYPLNFTTGTTQVGFNLGSANTQNIGTSCGNMDVAPALYNLADFGALVSSMGLSAQLTQPGVMTLNVNGTVYVVRPDYVVTRGTAAGAPSLVQGSDGLYRFTDSAGYVQILRPAFADPAGLAAQDQQLLATGGATTIQADGTALFTTLGGQSTLLTPDITLTIASGANAALLSWQDAANHYQFRGNTNTLAQGFAAKAR